MDFATYQRIDAINWSTLKAMAVSPLHYRHACAESKPSTAAQEIGQATHAAVLEPAEFAARYDIWTGGRRAGKAWDAFEAAAAVAGKIVLREQDVELVAAIAGAVRGNPVVAPYLTGPGDFERTIQWEDAETGLRCKGRLDRVAHHVPGVGRVLVDLKTARDIGPRLFGQAAARLGYHAQLAMYRDGLAAIGEPVDAVAIVVAESSAPHDSGLLILDDDVLYTGQSEYRSLLTRVATCRRDGAWPGRYPREDVLQLPAWVYADNGNDDGLFGLSMGGDDE